MLNLDQSIYALVYHILEVVRKVSRRGLLFEWRTEKIKSQGKKSKYPANGLRRIIHKGI